VVVVVVVVRGTTPHTTNGFMLIETPAGRVATTTLMTSQVVGLTGKDDRRATFWFGPGSET
jgi:hypothetical protein